MMVTLDLNGLWAFTVDQDPEYHRGYDYSRPTSLRHWQRVPVPGCWNRYAERYDLYEGVAWFVREFEVAQLPQDPVATLRFEGVNYLADVYLNGQHLGRHEGGYTAFEIDAGAALQAGANRLAIRVDNRHLRMRLPAVLGWYNYGGLHRGVSLHLTASAQLRAVRIAAEPRGPGAIGRLHIDASRPDLAVHAAIRDPAGAVAWEYQGAGGPWDIEVALPHAPPWTPERPALHRLEVTLRDGDHVLDRRKSSFGVRRLAVEGARLLLNGEPIHLRGICYLYDHPACGVAYDPRVAAADLDDLQALGVNCLRSHFPLPDALLDECDRRGLMLWLEAPIYCLHPPTDECDTPFADAGTMALARQMVREMVVQAHNHPSVVIWSVGNECNTDHPEAIAFFRGCIEEVRALDPERPISYAALYGAVGHMADLVDIISLNEYWGWYDLISYDGSRQPEPPPTLPVQLPQLEQCLAEKSALGKPLLLSEFGADAEPGFRSAAAELWSEDYQAELIARQLQIAAESPAVCGTFPFLYNDYRDPSKPISHHWRGLNLKGIVSYARRHKLAWERLQGIYRTTDAPRPRPTRGQL